MSEFKVESGVPVPPKNGKERYPFRVMEVGDSFSVPDADTFKKKAAAASQYAKGRTMKFSGSAAALRIWRIA